MRRPQILASLAAVCALAAPAVTQHSQVTSVAVDPNNPSRVWVCNRDNASVSVVNVSTGTVVAQISVGNWPRSLAFNADGTKVLVANQRGNVPVDVDFATPFSGSEVRGSISVIDTSSLTVTQTLTGVGTEPYGVALSPNGKYFAVSGFRSGTLKLLNAATLTEVASLQYLSNLSHLPLGKTIADADANKDFIADLSEPRAFVIKSGSTRIYVTHETSPYVSVVDVTLNGGGIPTGIALAAKIDTNEYPYDIFFNAVPVQSIESQGLPRFLDDIALSPDGTRALVPHLLHNINHDVNFDYGPGLAGHFANRVYPALTVIDASLNSYGQLGDSSARLHHEIADPDAPAQFIPFGPKGTATTTGVASLGGTGSPILGSSASFVMTGGKPGDIGFLAVGPETSLPLPPMGTLLISSVVQLFPMTNTAGTFTRSIRIPNNPNLDGKVFSTQGAVVEVPSLAILLSNGTRLALATQGTGAGNMGHRAGHPGRVLYNTAGDRVVMLNRGSEDVFLYAASGSSLSLMTAYPPRIGFTERAAFDNSTPMGDLPLGMALREDPATSNDDALLYVVNEGNRTLSTLRIDYDNGSIVKEKAQIPLLVNPDSFSLAERTGEELFEDASRNQTSGNFNNSCASCHFEGAGDGNVWQRGAGPRSTMPVWGGTRATGLILWKSVRVNLGETGPMFGGENGGTGVFTDAEQLGLTAYHEKIPVPLNPNLDPVTGALSPTAALGKDLFFGTNDTGANPLLRTAGCFNCHPVSDPLTLLPVSFTVDVLDPAIVDDLDYFEFNDPTCIALKENIIAIQFKNVNSGVNVDMDEDTFPDVDKNSDGYSDLETYTPMNVDDDDDFMRDDPNSWPCPEDEFNPTGPQKLFAREEASFTIPTKLGALASGPYMHDHVISSLRALVDPSSQVSDPIYGNPTYPGLQKFFNEFHDIRGHEDLVAQSSKVQLNLHSTDKQADIEAILAFIESL